MPTLLITGANRGIGLAFVQSFAADGWRVIATCRDPSSATELQAVPGEVVVHGLDVADRTAIAALADALSGEPIDLLLNNAGVYGGAQDFGGIDYEAWLDTFAVNTLAPVAMTEAFRSHLVAGSGRLVICLTSRMGSITEGGSGYFHYRSSKAALNMAARGMATALGQDGITLAVFHPGWVQTDMGGRAAPLSPSDSVAAMRRVFDRLGPADSGGFFDHDGSEIPW